MSGHTSLAPQTVPSPPRRPTLWLVFNVPHPLCQALVYSSAKAPAATEPLLPPSMHPPPAHLHPPWAGGPRGAAPRPPGRSAACLPRRASAAAGLRALPPAGCRCWKPRRRCCCCSVGCRRRRRRRRRRCRHRSDWPPRPGAASFPHRPAHRGQSNCGMFGQASRWAPVLTNMSAPPDMPAPAAAAHPVGRGARQLCGLRVVCGVACGLWEVLARCVGRTKRVAHTGVCGLSAARRDPALMRCEMILRIR